MEVAQAFTGFVCPPANEAAVKEAGMGVFGAMLTAVSGLQAQSYALENVSGNIANSQTVGFKRVDTGFVDLLPELPPRQAVAGSVAAFSRGTNTLQGNLQSTGVGTNIAISGQGFFVVQASNGFANNVPVFSGVDIYTRAGDFQLDKDGFLVNGSGFYLKGSSIDPVTGQVLGSASGVIQLSNVPIPAQKTNIVTYNANLASYPKTGNADQAVPQSELLDPADFGTDPTTGGSNTVVATDVNVFLNESISGGALTVYNDVGAPVSLQLRWAKIDGTAYGGTDTWNLFYLENANATGAQVAWRNVGSDVTFSSSGQLTSAQTINIPALAVNGTTVGSVDIAFGGTGLTQFADPNGQVNASTVRQDGFASGQLNSISITSGGRISGSYTNGQVVALAEISIANFSAPNSLKRLNGGAFGQTLESGQPIYGLNSATLIGGSVEGSNTDIADEFAKLIITQQAYSANTRVMTTAQQMLQDVINIIR
jgi:flagellar hook protein FlgE